MATIKMQNNNKGVTLIEILLVLVIVSLFLVLLVGIVPQRTDELRRSKVILQMQQILTGGLSYYIAKGRWPDDIDDMQTEHFLPAIIPFNNAWGQEYEALGFDWQNNPMEQGRGKFFAFTNVLNVANASLIAGKLPGAFVADAAGAQDAPPHRGACTSLPYAAACTYVVASVDMPGQNLSNANAYNFSSIYHSGACVPVPSCPVDKEGRAWKPEILVVPVSVSGTDQDATNVKSLSSYTAKAYGPVNISTNQIRSCYSDTQLDPCDRAPGVPQLAGAYWRVCLYVTTKTGLISISDSTKSDQGKATGSVVAMTRCVPAGGLNENVGASFEIWQR